MQKQILMAFLSYLISTLYTATAAMLLLLFISQLSACLSFRFDSFRFEDGMEFIEAEFRTKELKKLLVFFCDSLSICLNFIRYISFYLHTTFFYIRLPALCVCVSVCEAGESGLAFFSLYLFAYTFQSFSFQYYIFNFRLKNILC